MKPEELIQRIVRDFPEYMRDNLGIVPLYLIFEKYEESEEEIKDALRKLKYDPRVEVRITKTKLAENLGWKLYDLYGNGVNFGCIKIKDRGRIPPELLQGLEDAKKGDFADDPRDD